MKTRKPKGVKRKRKQFIRQAMSFFDELATSAIEELQTTKNIDDFNAIAAKLNIGKQLIAYASFTIEDLVALAKKDVKVMKTIQDTALNYISQILEKSKNEKQGQQSSVTVNFLNIDSKRAGAKVIEGNAIDAASLIEK